MNIESIPAAHPELADLFWEWDEPQSSWLIRGRIPLKIQGEIMQSDESEWTWICKKRASRLGLTWDFTETFADARTQAEQAVADWLRSQQREQALNALAEQAQELDMGY